MRLSKSQSICVMYVIHDISHFPDIPKRLLRHSSWYLHSNEGVNFMLFNTTRYEMVHESSCFILFFITRRFMQETFEYQMNGHFLELSSEEFFSLEFHV